RVQLLEDFLYLLGRCGGTGDRSSATDPENARAYPTHRKLYASKRIQASLTQNLRILSTIIQALFQSLYGSKWLSKEI
ncbi:hypothetical protein, partial [Klebsiella variicola]|uniref:hypothetical protein n=1 Tax=Klebsiella variicola TaxID=244366 RepID=UPI0039C3A651